MTKNKIYKVIISKDEETGYFVAEVPTLSPCITFGETIEEAFEMIQEAIEGVIESREENGYPVPDDSQELNTSKKKIETVVPFSYRSQKQLVTV